MNVPTFFLNHYMRGYSCMRHWIINIFLTLGSEICIFSKSNFIFGIYMFLIDLSNLFIKHTDKVINCIEKPQKHIVLF